MKKIRREFLLTSRVRSATAMIVLVLALSTIAVFAQTASVAGTWTGAIETPAVRLGIVVCLQAGDNGTWNGTIDIPQQGAKGVQLVDVSVSAPNVSFRISGAPGDPTIRVTVSDDGARMSGTLTQGGGTVPVSLTRGETGPVERATPKRPQTPLRSFPYLEEDVTTLLESTVEGNIFYDARTYEQRLTLPSGQTVTDTGKYVAILKRADREWKAAYITYNSDLPAMPCVSRQ